MKTRTARAAAPALVGAILFGSGPPALAASVTAPNAQIEKLAGNFEFTEGPASDGEGNVFFTDQPRDRILKWSVEGRLSTWMLGSGRANGLSFDSTGRLWACADQENELWRIDSGHNKEVVVLDFEGKKLNGPNDVWIAPGGGLYFSDPFYKRPYWKRGESEQSAQAVYFLSPGSPGQPRSPRRLARVAGDLKQPNGLIGTPDGKTLYVADIGDSKTYAYAVRPDGTLGDRKLFCSMGSDGMTLDDEGNVYLTGQGVTVFDSAGQQIERIAVPEPWTANVCFGGADMRSLFVTASKGLYKIAMRTRGVGSQ